MAIDPRRAQLHEILKSVLGSDNVYFQPPENLVLKFPCIVYNRSTAKTEFADNAPYSFSKQYEVKHISRSPESTVIDALAKLERCVHNRHFRAESLNHDVFSLYF